MSGTRSSKPDSNLFDPNVTLTKENISKFVKDALDSHNSYRHLHGVPPLELKNEVSAFSQKWADTLAKKNKMEHSKFQDRPNYGENIYWSSAKYVAGNLPVDSWYSEAEDEEYEYEGEPTMTTLKAGHFTQLVWKNSKYLGVGAAVGSSGIIVVCNYEPMGNMIGKYSENVLPPTEEV